MVGRLGSAAVGAAGVAPYTKAKEQCFPEEASGPSETELLIEIRDVPANLS